MERGSLAQLDHSHRRHDDVMAGLVEAARRLAAGRPHDADVQTIHEAVAYFQRAVTRHFLDEEGSVFPRLSTRRPELAEALAALSAEHPAQIALQNAIAEAARNLDGDTRMAAGKALLELAESLASQHRRHVEREDALFKDAHAALTEQDDADILAEMETRRDRDGDGTKRAGGGGGGGGGGRRRRAELEAAVLPKPAKAKHPALPGAVAAKPATKKPAAKAKPATKKPAAKAKPTKKTAKVKAAANRAVTKAKAAVKKIAAKKPKRR
jgi:hemerythrin-like domain-containing protein